MRRICVFGAGAIGGMVAAHLAEAGADVSVVARGAHLRAIQERGLMVRTEAGTMISRPQASDNPAVLGRQDAVIVTVKAPSLPEVARSIAPLLGPETPVVFLMNGIPWWYFHHHGGPHDGTRLDALDPGGALWDGMGVARAIGGVVYAPCTVAAPGEIHVEGSHSRIELGEPDGSLSPRIEALAGLLRKGGLPAQADPKIRDRIWTKLLLGLAFAPIQVLTQAPPSIAMQNDAVADAARRMIAEGQAIAAAMGCEAKLRDPEAPIRISRASGHKASALQDLEAGRKMEVDAMFGVPLQFARMAGVATPTLDLFVAMLKTRAQVAGLYNG